MKWQPIETADKNDGTPILVYVPKSEQKFWVADGYLSYQDTNLNHWHISCAEYDEGMGEPTHWAPLPDHP